MQDSSEYSIVKILSQDGTVVGAGFRIGKMKVLTCRHVIEGILPYYESTQKLPNGTVELLFHLDDSMKILRSHVCFWPLKKEDDFAILELEEEAPSCARIGKIMNTTVFRKESIRVCGFSATGEARWVKLNEMGPIDSTSVQIDVSRDTGYKIEKGFSGTPIFDDTSNFIIGIVSTIEKNEDILSATYITINSIINVCKKNPETVRYFKFLHEPIDPLETSLSDVASLIVKNLRNMPGDKDKKDNAIRYITHKHNIDTKLWSCNGDLYYPLAMEMLNLGPYKSLPIFVNLREHGDMEFKEIESIFYLLEPSWVDSESAECVSKRALYENKSAVALNANEYRSAKMCICRASGRPPRSWPTHRCLGRYGADAEDDMVKEIEKILITYNSRRLFSANNNSTNNKEPNQIRAALIRMINRDKEIGIPVFFIFNYSKDIAQILPFVHEVFPDITLFLLTGDTYPQPADFGKLDCKCLLNLGLEAEKKILEDIDYACGCLGISDIFNEKKNEC